MFNPAVEVSHLVFFFEVLLMKAWISLALIALALSGCAGKTAYRDSCATQLDAAWKELDLAKAEGFAGTVSYSKALSLLTGAKTQQQFEAFDGCTSKAERARFYIRESRAGR
ncbi:lipoprotein [Pseudomonas laurentiana]|nr:lipoprotein [Pseudomonas laurentiana]